MTTTYTTVAERFWGHGQLHDCRWVWHLLNVTKNMHAMHLHLVQFQAVRRDLYDVSGFDGETFATKMPLRFKKQLVRAKLERESGKTETQFALKPKERTCSITKVVVLHFKETIGMAD